MSTKQDKTSNGHDAVRVGIESAEVIAHPGTKRSSREKPAAKRVESPCGRFFTDPHGLFKKSFSEKPDIFISDPIEILAETREPEGNGWGLLLRWKDRDGVVHEKAFSRQLFSGDGQELRSRLADGGLTLSGAQGAKTAFIEWICSIKTSNRARSVYQTGWHFFPDGAVYVLQDEVFGQAGEPVVLQAEGSEPNLFGVRGTAEEWRDRIGVLCRGNSRLVLSAALGFAAPILALTGEDGGGFSIKGASRLGKSTALRLAASVCGGTLQAGAPGYVRSWRATGNALESTALSSCDALLCMDEAGQLDPREAGDVSYLLANGMGKARANRYGGARPVARWRILFLSTGELGIVDMNREAGKTTKAGQEVRFVDVPADAEQGLGLFETLHQAETPSELADIIQAEVRKIHGAPFRVFLDALTKQVKRDGQQKVAEDLRARLAEITDSYLQNMPHVSGQVRSVARRFALAALGGEMATALNLTGWDHDTSLELIRLCFLDWLRDRGTVGRREDEQAVQQLRDFIAANGEGRFERIQEAQEKEMPQSGQPVEPPQERFRTQMRAGWKKWEKGSDGRPEWRFYLTASAMREALAGLNSHDAKKVLIERGFIITPPKYQENKKAATVLNPPGYKAVRVYEVSGSILGSDAGDQ
ncbi:DNA helicase [Acetobacter tropicalis]|uniref:DNA helicase n=1 Tax=Acetobacter tropicalis TaxID=104102 RepID=A0A149TVA3_9PROT|nr:DUF927 domain-containing protein [Acetobacter tropicalis]KXV57144.1 DNA helicase [Acetobacter tropicalis]